MTGEQQGLWERIRRFELDDPEAVVPFSRKLAAEQGWSPGMTDRAIEEYRRFLLLAMVADQVVSPCDVVDQVWHLHLVYTRSYWQRLCEQTLGRPLHHEPSRGGADGAKYEATYQRTLALYTEVFGHAPPADIWPSAEHRRNRRAGWRRVDLQSHIVIPKRMATWAAMAVVAAMALLAVGCSPAGQGKGPGISNPFDLPGPQFLLLYGGLLVAAVVVIAISRFRARRTAEGPDIDTAHGLDPYNVSYLNGGAVLAVSTALVQLVDRNIIDIDRRSGRVTWLMPATPASLHPLERAIVRAIGLPARIRDIRPAVGHEVERIAERLAERGLVVPAGRAVMVQTIGQLLLGALTLAGLLKVIVGIARDRPVGYLVVLVLVTAALLLWAGRRPHRTKRGDRLLRAMQERRDDLRQLPPRLAGEDLAMGVALFGMSALATHEMSDLRRTFQPHEAGGSWVGGCGGDGDGGCGGGCGGCGGD